MPYDKNRQYTEKPFEYWLRKAYGYQQKTAGELFNRNERAIMAGVAPVNTYMGSPVDSARYMAFQDWFRPHGIDRSAYKPKGGDGGKGGGDRPIDDPGGFQTEPFKDKYISNPDLWGLSTMLAAMGGG